MQANGAVASHSNRPDIGANCDRLDFIVMQIIKSFLDKFFANSLPSPSGRAPRSVSDKNNCPFPRI